MLFQPDPFLSHGTHAGMFTSLSDSVKLWGILSAIVACQHGTIFRSKQRLDGTSWPDCLTYVNGVPL